MLVALFETLRDWSRKGFFHGPLGSVHGHCAPSNDTTHCHNPLSEGQNLTEKNLLIRATSCLLWAVLLTANVPANQLEQPVGMVLASEGAALHRSGDASALGAKVGDILFAGDSLKANGGTVSFQFCPKNSSHKVSGDAEVTFDENALRVDAGSLEDTKQLSLCVLPPVARGVPASQRHNGGSLTRDLAGPAAETTFQSRLQRLSPVERSALQSELATVDGALAEDAENLSAHVARAALLDRYNLSTDAKQQYNLILDKWPDAVWVKSRLFVHDEKEAKEAFQPPPPDPETAAEGKSFALLVGVSDYQNPNIIPLRYAHEDAILFQQHLQSPRGGSLPDENVQVLINEQATTAAIRTAIDTLLKTLAGPDDTVLVFVASHGTVDPETRQGFIVTYDSDPQDLASTALPMADLQNLVEEELSSVRRVQIYVDVCHSGKIGTIVDKKNRINRVVEDLGEADGEIIGFMASEPREVSFEGPQFGGGHGAFTYFLLNALNGAADYGQEGTVILNDMIDYVENRVEEATYDRQHPRRFGDFDRGTVMAKLDRPGVSIQPWKGVDPETKTALIAALSAGEDGSRSLVAPAVPRRRRSGDLPSDILMFQRALDANRILPNESNNAFTVLSSLRRRLPKQQYLEQSNALRVKLEIEGQQVLLRYLQGEQVPQEREDFLKGAALFEQARVLTPESLLLDARGSFCLGRVAIFDKDYARAADYLERAARLDPTGAYSYNALGIARLEQAQFTQAIAAFQDAIQRAPRWAYPYHNLALSYVQSGNYTGAIRTYQQAIEMAPDFAYLPYNLGLVYQRLNRRREAERAYRGAIAKAENLETQPRNRHLALAHNALGYLKASSGRPEEAEELYRQSLDYDGNLLEGRHNLAVLLAGARKGGQTSRAREAIDLWRENLEKDPEYLPSLLSLARVLDENGQTDNAIGQYETVVQARPEYLAARLRLADLQLRMNRPEAALEQLNAARDLQQDSAEIHERLGDVNKQLGRHAAAAEAYQAALRRAQDRKTKKRIRRKSSR